jgi:hypothetical protein
MKPTAVTIGPVRFSYANVWKPVSVQGGDPKFSCCALIKKDDAGKAMIDRCKKAINAAAAKGIEINKFTEKQAQGLRLPIRDGDAEYEMEKRTKEYQDHWFINCSNETAPGILGPDRTPLLDTSEFYSGCHGYINIEFFPYNTKGNIGIGASLQHVMKTKDDERLDGRISSDEAFAAVPAVDSTPSSGADLL